MCGCLLHVPHGDLAANPGLCPDWESNWRPFASQACTQSTEPHQPGSKSTYNADLTTSKLQGKVTSQSKINRARAEFSPAAECRRL